MKRREKQMGKVRNEIVWSDGAKKTCDGEKVRIGKEHFYFFYDPDAETTIILRCVPYNEQWIAKTHGSVVRLQNEGNQVRGGICIEISVDEMKKYIDEALRFECFNKEVLKETINRSENKERQR